MAVIPQWLTGRGVTAFNIIPQTVAAADGTLSAGTSRSLVGMWDSIEISYQPETEEISAADSARTNTVKLKDSWTFRCTQILRKAIGTGPVNPLASMVGANDIFSVTFTRTSNVTAGAGTASWTAPFLCTGYTESIAKGRSTGTATFALVDDGAGMVYPGASGVP